MKNKLYFIIVATLLCPTSLYAQSGTDKRSVLSFQTGPTLYTGKLIGIAGYFLEFAQRHRLVRKLYLPGRKQACH